MNVTRYSTPAASASFRHAFVGTPVLAVVAVSVMSFSLSKSGCCTEVTVIGGRRTAQSVAAPALDTDPVRRSPRWRVDGNHLDFANPRRNRRLGDRGEIRRIKCFVGVCGDARRVIQVRARRDDEAVPGLQAVERGEKELGDLEGLLFDEPPLEGL